MKAMLVMSFGFFAASTIAFAGATGSEGTPPPVEQASFHQLVFADADIAVLNNVYPPNGDSGFHTHHHDLFAVVIQSSPSSGQGLGKPLTASAAPQVGAAVYSPIGAEPRTHRIINGDQGVAQYIVVELRRTKPFGKTASSREPPYEKIFDNPRIRAWRLILEPGQSAPSISQGGKGVRVVVHGGLLATSRPGFPDQNLVLQAGGFAVQTSGETRALKNVGNETIEMIEIELK